MTDQELADAVENAIAPKVRCPKCGKLLDKPESMSRLRGCFPFVDQLGSQPVTMQIHHEWE